jgi:hypothetical protein
MRVSIPMLTYRLYFAEDMQKRCQIFVVYTNWL